MIVTNKRHRNSILTALADEEMQKILNLTILNRKSVHDIIKECNIPHTSAYRKIKWLINENLLIVDKILVTPEGKKISLFSSIYKSFKITYEKNKITIDADLLIDRNDRVAQYFFSL